MPDRAPRYGTFLKADRLLIKTPAVPLTCQVRNAEWPRQSLFDLLVTETKRAYWRCPSRRLQLGAMNEWVQPCGRRDFLRRAGEFVVALHLPGLRSVHGQFTDPGGKSAKQDIAARFSHIRLQTHRLEELQEFYSKTIGLPIVADTARSVTFRAGASAIEFVQTDDGFEPFYHFAFTIPENKFHLGKEWLKSRCPLLRFPDGTDEVFFEGWNAHATYFHDPAHNIVEFIARHTLANAAPGPFGLDDILCTSEIGLVTRDQEATSKAITAAFGIERYGKSYFFTGDANGVFVIPTVGRLWIPEQKQPATIFPVQVTVRSGDRPPLRFADLPYEIFTAG